MRKIRNSKGITLVALVVTIIILIILAGVSINIVFDEDGIIQKAKRAAQNMEIAVEEEQIQLDNLYMQMDSIASYNTDKKVNTPMLLNGMSPIKFGEATQTSVGQTIITNSNDENWYNYESKKWANAQTKDGSMWVWIPRFAYKITYYTDETKQTISTTKTSYGSIDVKFLIGTTDNYYKEDGTIEKAQRQTRVNQTIDTTLDYTVHPAFTNESKIGYANGGWDKELTGIWVAKFEAGYASGGNNAQVVASNVRYTDTISFVWKKEAGTTNDSAQPARNWLDGVYVVKSGNNYEWKDGKETAIKYPVFQGSTYAMNYINQNDAYEISRALTDSENIYGLNKSNTDSHLMKNSEWGAVAYLSKSKYGLENTDIAINSKTLNSGGATRTSDEEKTGVESVYAVTGYNASNNKWNEYLGENLSASTTGNMYGIYDLSGGTWEKTTGMISNGTDRLYIYGKSIIDEANVEYIVNEETGAATVNRNTGSSTKYVTIYLNNDEGQSNKTIACQKNYEINTNIYGDAIRETSTAGTDNTSWYSDYSDFPRLINPFSIYGGNWLNDYKAGLFSFGETSGSGNYGGGFRAVLVNK